MADAQLSELIQTLAVIALPALLAITCHEAAHGIVAYWLGDDTAYRQGRVTLNPIRHIDPFGTVILPLLLFMVAHVLFGYAKPVPTNASRMGSPRRDMVLVALAGPGMNLLLATISAALFYTLPWIPQIALDWVRSTLEFSVLFNLVIGGLQPAAGAAARRRPRRRRHPAAAAWPIRFARLGRYGYPGGACVVFFILPQLGGPAGRCRSARSAG
jgi:Zn-dependent protease